MKPLHTLIREAETHTAARGHRLLWKHATAGYQRFSTGTCRCGAYVQCNEHPRPNGIAIGGDALAFNCPLSPLAHTAAS